MQIISISLVTGGCDSSSDLADAVETVGYLHDAPLLESRVGSNCVGTRSVCVDVAACMCAAMHGFKHR